MGAGSSLVITAVALAAPPTDVESRRLANRLELWGTFARRTKSVVARFNGRRESSLLFEPLVSAGAIAFVAPATLVLRDDGLTGSNTRIESADVTIRPNEASVPNGPRIVPNELPALGWLRDRLIALFNPGDGEALIANSRVLVPRHRKPKLEFLPPLDSAERKLIRSLTITLDPVGGAVLQIDLQEAQGDRFVLNLSDHRQNPSDSELERVL